jgi:hypothetical protein
MNEDKTNKHRHNSPFVMSKDRFEKCDNGNGGKILLAECPNCHDTVVWREGCVKCNAEFEFKPLSIRWRK